MRTFVAAVCLLMCCALALAAQQAQTGGAPAPPQAANAPGPQPIKVTTQLIVEEVTVKDKNGKPVEGLTASDFTLTEDGVPQTISFAQFQRIESAPAPAASAPPAPPAVVTAPPVTQIQIAPETPGD